MIKVLHIVQNEKAIGSTAVGVLLHGALPYLGIASYLAVAEQNSGGNHYGTVPLYSSVTHGNETINTLTDTVKQLLEMVDVIHLHASQDAIVAPIFRAVKELGNKPVIWSLTDCLPYTGGCYFSARCEQWYQGCQDCPLVSEPENKVQKAQVLQLKENMYSGLERLAVVCGSKWQCAQAVTGILHQKRQYPIPSMVNYQDFYVGDQQVARSHLGLPQDSIILVVRHAGINVVRELQKVVLSFCDHIIPLTIIYVDGKLEGNMHCLYRNVEHECGACGLYPEVLEAALMGAYYRAADLYIDFRESGLYPEVLEAAACACPSAILDQGEATELVSNDTGFVMNQVDGKVLFEIVKKRLAEQGYLRPFGDRARAKVIREHNNLAIARQYGAVYQEMLQARQPQGEPETTAQRVRCALPAGMEGIKRLFAASLAEVEKKEPNKRTYFIDEFSLICLQEMDVLKNPVDIWSIFKLWKEARGNINLDKSGTDAEDSMYLSFITTLREALVKWFTHFDLETFRKVEVTYVNDIYQLWDKVFLHAKSFLNTMTPYQQEKPDFSQIDKAAGYPYVFLNSMYVPYNDAGGLWNADAVLTAPLPKSMLFVLMFWLVQVPLYDGKEEHRTIALRYVTDFSRALTAQLERFTKMECNLVVAHFMSALWRISYLGGNNIEPLRAYGDLLQAVVKQFFPSYCETVAPRKRAQGEKVRIGYVSLRFRNQAVSQYMANRIFHCDRERFYVKCFSLGAHKDTMTERIENSCDEFVTFPDLSDMIESIESIASAIRASDLDILIYPDIGMDNVTYLLGAMRLAPVQAVLVGHGTTSGLSTIDYYISGDHEPRQASRHYVEKLVRLPDLGAAQLPPLGTEMEMSRADIGVPDDAVVLLSCANGLKHVIERDRLLIDILRQVDNAYVVLKPFQDEASIDCKFINRLKTAARKAGVENRLILLNPLKRAGDLMNLVKLADIQLDTYPYGGWTTNMEALYYHLPIVTQEGKIARTRWGAGLLRVLGVTEGIAANEKEYVKWAVKFAKEEPLRKQVTARIAEQVEKVLFNGQAAQAAYEKVLQEIAKFS